MSRYDGTKQEPILMMERWPERFETVWSVYDNRSGTGRENTAAIITPSATWICHVILPLLRLPVLCLTQSFRCPPRVSYILYLAELSFEEWFQDECQITIIAQPTIEGAQPWYVNVDSDKRIYISYGLSEKDRRINSSRLRESLFSIL